MPTIDRVKSREAADKQFVRQQQKADASVAMADYLGAQKAMREKTQKLREQRLLREANEAADATTAPAPVAKKSRKRA